MQVYVDESGDPGMKGKRGSSTIFVISAVLFANDAAAQDCRTRIRDLHRRLEWGPRQEFKFNKTDTRIKGLFFEAVAPCDFKHVSVVLNKAMLTSPSFKDKESFYKEAARLVFSNAARYLSDATVVIDHCGSRDFRDQMSRYLKAHIIDPRGLSPIRSVRTEKSHACELLQLADMVVGAVARSMQRHKPLASVFRSTLSRHELAVQVWPQ